MDFTNKTILITGASSGIGKALAVRLSSYNCKLILTARRENLINNYRNELTLPDEDLLILKSDVSNKESVAETYKKAIDKFSSIDVAILNAGAGKNITIENFNSKAAEMIYGANVMGLVYWVEQLLPEFTKRKSGIIAGVSSMADNRGYSGSGFYCSSKAAATIFLEGLRVELKPHGVKVITIRPGFVKTPMTDQNNFNMPFLISPEKAAGIIAQGIKKEKRVIQFPRPMAFLTTLAGLLPGRFYEFLASKAKV